MGARQSPEMAVAQDLVTKKGYTQYRAAQETGVTRGAISRAKWYREYIAKKEARSAQARKAAKARHAKARKAATA